MDPSKTVDPWTMSGSTRVCAQSFSGVCQAPLPMELSRQEYWSGLLFLSLGDLSDAGIEPVFLVSPALAGGFFTTLPSGKLTLISGISLKKNNMELAFCICGFCIHRFNQLWTADSIQNLRLVEYVMQNLWLWRAHSESWVYAGFCINTGPGTNPLADPKGGL